MSANAAAPPSAWKAGLGSHSWLDYTAQTQHSCHQPQGRRSFRVVFSKIARRLPCFRPEKVIWSTASFWVTIIRGIVSQTVRQNRHDFSNSGFGTVANEVVDSRLPPGIEDSNPGKGVFPTRRPLNELATLRLVTALLGLGLLAREAKLLYEKARAADRLLVATPEEVRTLAAGGAR